MENGYNGWANWETWNVALWIQNDEGLYAMAKRMKRLKYAYVTLSNALSEIGITETPDGASYSDKNLDRIALNEMMRGL